MSYTFGGATTNKYQISRSAGIPNAVWLFCGWFKPTTLTAGNGLFSNGTGITGVAIAATTSELKSTTDHATTDGVFTTSGLGLVVDVWQFIAILQTATTSAGACRVWMGTVDTAPQEVTVTTTTAPVGATVVQSTMNVGQIGSVGTVAFQGVIEQCVLVVQAAAGVAASLPVAAAGTIAQNEADQVLRQAVVPFWNGQPPVLGSIQVSTNLDLTLFDMGGYNAFGVTPIVTVNSSAVSPLNANLTATRNEERSGASLLTSWPVAPVLVRR